jgi:hypothetical protein
MELSKTQTYLLMQYREEALKFEQWYLGDL